MPSQEIQGKPTAPSSLHLTNAAASAIDSWLTAFASTQCDGNTPACAACASVYHTECVYDLNSDHRRKGVYKKDIDNLKTQNGTLQTLVEAILTVRRQLPFKCGVLTWLVSRRACF